MQKTLLLVDDEENILRALSRMFRPDGYRVLTATSGAAGLELLTQHEVGVIMSDQRMPGMTGSEFLSQVKVSYPDTIRIVLSGYTELKSVTDAINQGAVYKFLTKPWEDELLRKNVEDAFAHYELRSENRRLTRELQKANRELAVINQDLNQRVEEQTRDLWLQLHALTVSQEVLEHLPVAVLGIDDNGMIVVANRMAHELLGVATGHLIGASVETTLPLPVRTHLDASRRAATHAVVVEIDATRRVDLWCHPLDAAAHARGMVMVLRHLATTP